MKVLLKDGNIAEAEFDDLEGKKAFWHASAHVLAQAVKRLYPETKCAVGAVIENGFYYDFDFGESFSDENLSTIEAEMKKIVKESLSLQVFALGKAEALAFTEERGELYQAEIIRGLPDDEKISFYKQGEYAELCDGPHISNTCQIKAVKLLSVAGAYWRGDERNKMLTRIYGVSFPKGVQLDEYLHLLEEAKARDHRKLGKQLGIFVLLEEGMGFPFFLPKGMVLKNLLIDYWQELHGLMRVRACTQDDAHIFMTQEQIVGEIQNVARLIDTVYTRFGFEYRVELSTRPEDSIGSAKDWELATQALSSAMDSMGIPYSVNEGDGAFYGPKLDFHLKDSIGRTWQCGTIQLDFQLPQRFEIEYIGTDGAKHRPIMIHRAIFGSIERFMGILIEHYAGNFPVWLAPVQVKLLPVSDKFLSYADAVLEELKAAGIRVEIDTRDEKLGYKIREARLDKVPFMVVVGEKEQVHNTVSVRVRDADANGQDMGEMSVYGLIELLRSLDRC